ncbi:heme peroxidase [filamentous cyanobacterium CCP5]|nr:heme peroxidase [filamentous cyanobacterium CCP5]
MARDTSRDGFLNRLELFVLTHFRGLWWLIQQSPQLTRWVNRFLSNRTIYRVDTRPYPFSLMTLDEHIPDTDRPKKTDTYTSWESLIDRTYTGRHLPPDPEFNQRVDLPDPQEAAVLFRKRNGETIYSEKSTLLFPYWAQWFTDGFLRTDRENRLRNTSNHHIDLAPVYGLSRQKTYLLRTFSGGRLKSQQINGEEYPLFFYEDPEQGVIKAEFQDLYIPLNDEVRLPPERKAKLFAMGVERANVQIGYVMLNVICLREHNRVCDILAATYPDWDDERLFQTARNILIVTIMKIVIEDYVNHITPYHFNVILDPLSFTDEKWYRQNWMTIEFDFVYRWHSALPETFIFAGDRLPMTSSLWNNQMILDRGVGTILEETCAQPATQIGLFNTPDFLVDLTEVPTIALGRKTQLASYNDYREAYQYPRVTRFNQISGNPETQALLEQLYGHVDNVELYVGLYAEDAPEHAVLGPLITRMIGIDALSHVLTNPLLAENIYNKDTFSPVGWEIIHETKTLSDLVNRNVVFEDGPFNVTFYRS